MKTLDCACPNTDCADHGECSACVAKHRAADSLTYCFFPNNDGDKSLENFYHHLEKRFTKETAE
ncbi:MAG: DUF6485 family protein [Candidatus Margulisbacteria bacterium]|nr:DUF6485 family protein [Candidatus Margulisiibacteriota bacterium]